METGASYRLPCSTLGENLLRPAPVIPYLCPFGQAYYGRDEPDSRDSVMKFNRDYNAWPVPAKDGSTERAVQPPSASPAANPQAEDLFDDF